MSSYYRFRPIDRLLGKSRELETQTIYFAGPDELNDPMEGRADVMFRGDDIVWENLFRHFVACLTWAVVASASGEDRPIRVVDMPIEDPLDSKVESVVRAIEELADRLVATPEIQMLVAHLANRGSPASESELRFYLKQLHPAWTVAILDALPGHPLGGNVSVATPPDVLAVVRATDETLAGMAGKSDVESRLEAMFQAAEVRAQQRNVHLWAKTDRPAGPNHRFVYLDFVDHYLTGLRRLLHPDWYTACFMDDVGNSAVWGHYANGHRDVCLKFRAKSVGERHTLPLRVPAGFNREETLWSTLDLEFQPVRYTDEGVRLNFFTAMGNLPVPMLNKVWRVSRTGKLSAIEQEVHGDEHRWRAGYWQQFEAAITRKNTEWAPEREHRLTFHSNILNLAPAGMRLMRYNFEDLEAIVFGIKTSDADKQALFQLVQAKCVATGRHDFEFFQAVRNAGSRQIELQSLGHIRNTRPEPSTG
ncbi:hypothetical protein [Luteibacter aegosomatissinici]|uniref:hypothetical protein n=1 Tax=Luteibacter aegosomatissinici TaxID=2911539 RepID=UPI001FF7E6BA|nr:hypothetical protein [Luteibacter aegosomatissinici]UPG92698.1 hypothetical protein L2Y97_12560 [Luteibacter aegosomatissinici]